MKIVLLGYMGSGKSAVGNSLATTLKWPIVDLDTRIEEKAEMSISQIFDRKGEIYFRKLERATLQEVLSQEQSLVLATGGGTPCYGDNLQLLNESEAVITVFLKTKIPTLMARLKPEASQRPLIAHLDSDEALVEFIGKHLFERNKFYQQADYTIDTDDKTPQHIVEEIVLPLF